MAPRLSLILILALLYPGPGVSQEAPRLFPSRDLFPDLLAGPRDPVSSATVMGVVRNPSAHGRGVEVEVSIGTTLPIYLLAGTPDRNPVVVGMEAAAFARFGLQLLERELVATDWFFAIPVIWHHDRGWIRFRYYHSSSHMGDEYNRRFGDPGINISRDAADVFLFRQQTEVLGTWIGARFGYNVHPQENEPWVWDQEAKMRPRVEVRVGTWLPKVDDRRALRISVVVLTGPSPLGQFRFGETTQIGFSLQGRL